MYYRKINGEILLTEEGHNVLSFFGLTLEDLQVMSKEQLIAHTKKFSDILNDGRITKGNGHFSKHPRLEGKIYGKFRGVEQEESFIKDEGSYSRYFSLDQWWAKTFPFLVVAKASKQEKNKGLDGIPDKFVPVFDETKWIRKNEPDKEVISQYLKEWRSRAGLSSKQLAEHFPSLTGGVTGCVWNWENGANIPTVDEWLKLKEILGFDDKYDKIMTEMIEIDKEQSIQDTKFPQVRRNYKHNHHPTVKPIKLMSYLITMGSREGDLVLDPFCGSGTTLLAAHQLHRKYLGIELNPEYAQIIKKRMLEVQAQLKLSVFT